VAIEVYGFVDIRWNALAIAALQEVVCSNVH